MLIPILYTVLSVVNLIGYAIGVSFLPATVPLNYGYGADAFGSPWVFVALPAAAALMSLAVWATAYFKKGKAAKYVTVVLCVVGVIFVALGWTFFGLSAR